MIIIKPDGIGSLTVRFSYDLDIKNAVKGVPTSRWDPFSKVWIVSAGVAAPLRIALSRWESQLVWEGMAPPPLPHQTPRPDTGSWAKTLLTVVGPSRADAVFRALSKVLHPDVPTGDSALMQELVAARDDHRSSHRSAA